MKMGKILITGGLGFIGIHTIINIINNYQYNNIVLLDEKINCFFKIQNEVITYPNIEYIKGSILEEKIFDNLEKDFDYIIHTAGILGITKVAKESILTLDVNILGTINLLNFVAKQKNLKRFLTFSTSEIYGSIAEDLSEEMPAVIPSVGSRWCYAASKLITEQYTKAYQREKNVPYTIIRPFNIYGPYREGSNAISTFINKALNNEKIQISGDGTQKRSWCYIDDFIDAIFKAMIAPSLKNETLNIGNPDNFISIYDLAKLVLQITRSSSEILITESQTEDVKSRKPNIDKAKELLNFKPYISLEEGIKRTVDSVKFEKEIA